jgi:hypothetical protein
VDTVPSFDKEKKVTKRKNTRCVRLIVPLYDLSRSTLYAPTNKQYQRAATKQ